MAKQKSNTSEPTNSYALSRYNSLNHGVLSRMRVLPWEDAQELEEIQNTFLEEHQPKGATEKYLVLELANIAFRRQRLYQAENALICKILSGSDGYWLSHVAKEAKFLNKEDWERDDSNNQDGLKAALYYDLKGDNVEVNERYQTIEHVQKLIESTLSYEKILSKLDPEVAELWQECLNDDEENDFTPTKESLIEFLKENIIKYNQEICASIKARPYVRQHAIGKSYIPNESTEKLQRYETSLDRRFERLLGMLLKLQNSRRENTVITVEKAAS